MRFPLLACLAGAAVALPSSLIARANDADLNKCPGYAASNVVVTDTSLKADLKLNGDKCNVYGHDLENLKLEVEHQTGEYLIIFLSCTLLT